MVEIYQKPPSRIKIRTLESDVEEMRAGGGELSGLRTLGKSLEEWEEKLKGEKAEPIFQEVEEIPPEILAKRKSKFFFLPLLLPLLLILIFGIYWFFLRPRPTPLPIASPSPTLQFSSLLKNFSGERSYRIFDGQLASFEKILYEEFQEMNTGESKEIVFLEDESHLFSAEKFLKLLFKDFSEIPLADQPNFKEPFAFLIYHQGKEVPSLAYLVQLDPKELSIFALVNLKNRFATALERFLIENSSLFASQYLQDVGEPQGVFRTEEISFLKARYLEFSTGLRFYYAFSENNLFFATSKEALEKILSFFLNPS